jgi:hypothetical protein
MFILGSVLDVLFLCMYKLAPALQHRIFLSRFVASGEIEKQ